MTELIKQKLLAKFSQVNFRGSHEILEQFDKSIKSYIKMFKAAGLRGIDFQNNFIATFSCSMFTIWKSFLQTRLTCTRGVPTTKIKIFGKVHFFKKATLTMI